ncbi:MAG: hypothetical protein Q8P49_02940 [Candidatus Liptonbacteria bacterium]|nr:hypothetical protein [Candidatus Liptonbacteria bacterium]
MEREVKLEMAGEGELDTERERFVRNLGDLAENLKHFSELKTPFPLGAEVKERIAAIKEFVAAHEENATALAVALGSAGAKIWESLDVIVGEVQSAQGNSAFISYNSLESQDLLKALGIGAAAFIFQKQISKYWPEFEKLVGEFGEYLKKSKELEAEFLKVYGRAENASGLE